MFNLRHFIVVMGAFFVLSCVQAQTANPQTLFSQDVLLAPKAKAQFEAGREALLSQKYSDALKRFQSVYSVAPGNPVVNLSLGVTYLTLRQFERANLYLDRANSLAPMSFRPITALAILRLEEANYEDGTEKAEVAVRRAPKQYLPHWVLAEGYLLQHRFKAALNQAHLALRFGKNAASGAKFIIGASLAETGHKPEARKALQEFVQENPTNPDVTTAQKIIADLNSK